MLNTQEIRDKLLTMEAEDHVVHSLCDEVDRLRGELDKSQAELGGWKAIIERMRKQLKAQKKEEKMSDYPNVDAFIRKDFVDSQKMYCEVVVMQKQLEALKVEANRSQTRNEALKGECIHYRADRDRLQKQLEALKQHNQKQVRNVMRYRDMAVVSETTEIPQQSASRYPGINSLAHGCVSGTFAEWPQLRIEAEAVLKQVEAQREKLTENETVFKFWRGAQQAAWQMHEALRAGWNKSEEQVIEKDKELRRLEKLLANQNKEFNDRILDVLNLRGENEELRTNLDAIAALSKET